MSRRRELGRSNIEYREAKAIAREPVRRRTRLRGECERLPDYCTCEDQNRSYHPDCAKRVSRALSEERGRGLLKRRGKLIYIAGIDIERVWLL